MKRFHTVLFLFLLALTAATSPAVRADDPPAIVPGWHTARAMPQNQTEEYAIGIDTTESHGGKKSVYIKSVVEKPNGFRPCPQAIKADAFRGKRVRLTGYIKTKNVNTSRMSGFWMRVDAADGSVLGYDNMASRPIKGTTDWKAYSVVLDVPQSAEAIFFGATLSGSGTLWMDDLTLEAVDAQSVAITGTDQKTEEAQVKAEDARRKAYLGTLPSQGVNLNFDAPAGEKSISGWLPTGSQDTSYDFGLNMVEKRSGEMSAYIKSVGGKPENFRGLGQNIKADAYRDKRVRLSGSFKTDHVTSGAGLWMSVSNLEGQSLGYDNMRDGLTDRWLRGTADWQTCSVVLDVPKEAFVINFGGLLSGSGEIWMDDLKVETVDPQTVAVTGRPQLKRDTPNEDRKKAAIGLPTAPVNLDFEK